MFYFPLPPSLPSLPLSLSLPSDDVIRILSNDLNPSQYSSSFIITYATLVWNVVSPVSRDLTDLLYIVS